ncbi:hypothetical protein Rhopal_005218-T1 [Rhodotorula paludigena]|uniref:phosphoglycerate mutase (2,3-diphosphoglycerate-dependent) n=1 Tax=Rhodotorula paludigena TaxID=86838 RepID=A0AAV5GPU9_9BASI|nr:hypothetical protein Rhopal_005218-T1 [Rhodotorula paludigena]
MATRHFAIPAANRLASLPVESLNEVFAHLLSSAVASNDKLPTKGAITRYHSKQPPPLEIGAYLARLTKYTPFPRDAVILGIVYLNRITHLPYTSEPGIHPAPLLSDPPATPDRLAPPTSPIEAPSPLPPSPTISGVERPRVSPFLNSYTLHRLVLATLLIACKFSVDGTLSQSRVAKVGGVGAHELCKLEGECLRLLGWSLMWTLDEVDNACAEVERVGEELGVWPKEAEERRARQKDEAQAPREEDSFRASTSRLPSPPRLVIPSNEPPSRSSCVPVAPSVPPSTSSLASTAPSSEASTSQPSSSASSPRLFSPCTESRQHKRSFLSAAPAEARTEEAEDDEPTPPSSPSVSSADGSEGVRAKVREDVERAALSPRASTETLILVRHGQSETNAANIFTGTLDPPLTAREENEARTLGTKLRDLDLILEALDQHPSPAITVDAALNERDYGLLNGRDKDWAAREYGAEQVQAWRRGYRAVPPGGESLEMTVERVWRYYEREILPRLERGECVLVVSHGNTLRGVCMRLDGLDEDEVLKLQLGTGAYRVYRIDADGEVVERRTFAVNGLEGGPQ